MTKLQDDLLEVYNNLVELQDLVLGDFPCPVSVTYDSGMGCLSFRCHGKGIYLRPLSYYISRPDLIKDTYLLPEDYDSLVDNLGKTIKSNRLVQDHTLVSPDFTGFDIFVSDSRNLSRGAQYLRTFSFVSGTSWWFKWKTRRKYKRVLI